MGRLLKPVSNGRIRLMIETAFGRHRTRLTGLLLKKLPFLQNRKGLFFVYRKVFNFLYKSYILVRLTFTPFSLKNNR